MPTVYHHPLTQSVEANTRFNPVIPAEYETSAESSIYTIVSENIFIGGPQTETITFTCNNFKDIQFKEEGCGTEDVPRTLTVDDLCNLTDTIKIINGTVIFDLPVTFNNNITVKGDATIDGYLYLKDQYHINFTENGLNLEEYISGNNWEFSAVINFTNDVTFAGDVTFADPDKIFVDSSTTLETYVTHVAGEVGGFKIRIVNTLPETGEKNIIYLVPNESDPGTYKEYIWVTDEDKFEQIGTTGAKLDGAIMKNEDNTLPNYTNPEYTQFSGHPGVLFNGKFYSFECLKTDDPDNPYEKLDERYVKKLPECNEMEPYGQEIGLCFNGNFYSFESLCTKQLKGPKFEADNVEIPVDQKTFVQIYTVPNAKSSVRITPINDEADKNFIILDAISIDQNATQWIEIDYIDREPDTSGKMGVNMTIYPQTTQDDLTAWLSIKTLDIVNGEVFDSQVFFRNKDSIEIPQYHANNKFKYKINTDSTYTRLEESNLVINVEIGTNKVYITHDCFILLDVHLVSENGLCSVGGFSNNEIMLNVDDSKTGTDWLAIKCLNDVDGVVFYRTIKLIK